MKSIIFSEPLFHAVIAGRKTQERRIVKPQPDYFTHDEYKYPLKSTKSGIGKDINPRYKIGNILYLKEPYHISNLMVQVTEYKYGSDLPKEVIERAKWRNLLFMPAKYARYFIKITGVRCERLQDISDEDCLKEGVEPLCMSATQIIQQGQLYRDYLCKSKDFFQDGLTLKKSYASLLDSINGAGTWEKNPFVWIYDFELCDGN
jgi:hypothetical protein